MTVPRKTNKSGTKGKRTKKIELEVNKKKNVAKPQNVADENAIGAGGAVQARSVNIKRKPLMEKRSTDEQNKKKVKNQKSVTKTDRSSEDGTLDQPSTSEQRHSGESKTLSNNRGTVIRQRYSAGENARDRETSRCFSLEEWKGNGFPEDLSELADRNNLDSSTCIFCKKSDEEARLFNCHGFLHGIMDGGAIDVRCKNKFHRECIQKYNIGDFNAEYASRPENQARLLCPDHACEQCNAREMKQSAYEEDENVRCVKCICSFHLRCIPSGSILVEEEVIPDKKRTKNDQDKMVKIQSIICPRHEFQDFELGQHVDGCCSRICTNPTSSENMLRCKQCVNSIHKSCSQTDKVGGVGKNEDICDKCLRRYTIPLGSFVFAWSEKHTKFLPGQILNWEDVPAQQTPVEKLGVAAIKFALSGSIEVVPLNRIAELTESNVHFAQPDCKETFLKYLEMELKGWTSRCPPVNKLVWKFQETLKYNLPKSSSRYEIITPTECCLDKERTTTNKGQHLCTLDKCGSGCPNRLLGFECPPTCKVTGCTNQLSKQADGSKVDLFKTGFKGMGVKALVDICANTPLVGYTGEVIDNAEKERRRKVIDESRDKQKSLYVAKRKQNHYIDSVRYGNNARYINHSCRPNIIFENTLACVAEIKNGTFKYEEQIIAVSKRPIQEGEEVTLSYGYRKEDGECKCGEEICDKIMSIKPNHIIVKADKQKKDNALRAKACELGQKRKHDVSSIQSSSAIHQPSSSSPPEVTHHINISPPESPQGQPTSSLPPSSSPDSVDLNAHLLPVPVPSEDEEDDDVPEMTRKHQQRPEAPANKKGAKKWAAEQDRRLRTKIEEALQVANKPISWGAWKRAMEPEFDVGCRGLDKPFKKAVDSIINDKEKPVEGRVLAAFLTKQKIGDSLKTEFQTVGELVLHPCGSIKSATVNGISITSGGRLVETGVEEEEDLGGEGGNDVVEEEGEEEGIPVKVTQSGNDEPNEGEEEEGRDDENRIVEEPEAVPEVQEEEERATYQAGPSDAEPYNIPGQDINDLETENNVENNMREEPGNCEETGETATEDPSKLPNPVNREIKEEPREEEQAEAPQEPPRKRARTEPVAPPPAPRPVLPSSPPSAPIEELPHSQLNRVIKTEPVDEPVQEEVSQPDKITATEFLSRVSTFLAKLNTKNEDVDKFVKFTRSKTDFVHSELIDFKEANTHLRKILKVILQNAVDPKNDEEEIVCTKVFTKIVEIQLLHFLDSFAAFVGSFTYQWEEMEELQKVILEEKEKRQNQNKFVRTSDLLESIPVFVEFSLLLKFKEWKKKQN